MNLILLVVLLVGLTPFWQAPDRSRCQCKTSLEDTREGANENVIFAERKKRHRLEGVVRNGSGEILPDVLVEVFDEPNYLLLEYPQSGAAKKKQKRLRGCVVGADGKFCFRDLPPGKYELRFSKNGGWNNTHVFVILAPPGKKASRQKLDVSMSLGT